MHDILHRFINKSLLDFQYVHLFLYEYALEVMKLDKNYNYTSIDKELDTDYNSSEATEEVKLTQFKRRISDLINSLIEFTPKLLSTKMGAKLVCILTSYSNAKEKKIIIKSIKGKVLESVCHPTAHLGIMRMMDATDDTVFVQKSILNEISSLKAPPAQYTPTGDLIDSSVIPPLIQVAMSPYGRKVLARLLTPQSNHIELDELEYFQEGVQNMGIDPSSETDSGTGSESPICDALIRKRAVAVQERSDSMVGLQLTQQMRLNVMHGLQGLVYSGITGAYANLLIMSVHHLETNEYLWQLMGHYCRVQLDMHGFHWARSSSSGAGSEEFIHTHEGDQYDQYQEQDQDQEQYQEQFFSTVFSIQKRSVTGSRSSVNYAVDSFIESGVQMYRSAITSILAELYHRLSMISVEGSVLQLGFLGSVFVSQYTPVLALLYGASLLFARANYEILTEIRPVSASASMYHADLPLSLPSPPPIDMDIDMDMSETGGGQTTNETTDTQGITFNNQFQLDLASQSQLELESALELEFESDHWEFDIETLESESGNNTQDSLSYYGFADTEPNMASLSTMNSIHSDM